MPFEWQLGWRLLRAGQGGGAGQNRFIGFIAAASMLGIALGVAALIIVMSVMNGFRKEVRDRMLDVIAHVEVHDVSGQGLPLALPPQAVASAPLVQLQGLLGRDDVLRGALVRGIEPAAEAQVTPLARRLQGGVLKALQPGARQIVLGVELARQVQVQAGDAVTLIVSPETSAQGRSAAAAPTLPRQTRFTVAGTFEAGHFEYDNGLAFIHMADALALLGQTQATALHLRLREADEAPQVAAQLASTLNGRAVVRDWTQSNRAWFAAVQQQKRMLGLILVLIVAVAAFNLVSTLVMTVTDKRAEIAILRTLGASPGSIMGIFMVQGALAGALGTGAGVLLGLGVAMNVDVIVPAIERLLGMTLLSGNVYLISRMPSLPLASDVVPIALASLALAFVATLYPSWRASQVQPAQALRHE
jgi:lipoprotein-releasing system permease protein